MAGVAGSNIANAVAGGITYPGGGASSPVVPAYQPCIGEYVQDDLDINGATNVLGVDLHTAWTTNVMGEEIDQDFIAPSTFAADDPALDAQWCVAGGTIAYNATCTITDGVATTGGAGGWQCKVTGGVTAGQYFWALIDAGG